MEDPDVRMAAETDPRGFLNDIPDGGIIDEIQRLPVLLSYIQGLVDEKQKSGMFILTGSHQPDVHNAVSQTLAGRTALLNLLPFSLSELLKYKKKWDAFDIIVQGCFPRLHHQGLTAARFYNGYIQTYVERDLRTLINIKDLNQFQLEIKSAATFTKVFLKGIEKFRKLAKNRCRQGYVLYNGIESYHLNGISKHNILLHNKFLSL